jgi:predicted O-methyltransferase YrrM
MRPPCHVPRIRLKFSIFLLALISLPALSRTKRIPRSPETVERYTNARLDGTFLRKCHLGHFGPKCAINITAFYYEHDVYEGFEPLSEAQMSGWSPTKEFYADIVSQVKPRLIVEVGVWRGLSLIYLASSLKELTGGGAVIAVDTWLGAPEFWNRKFSSGAKDATRDLRWKHGYPQVYYEFLSNVVKNDLQDTVIPLPVPSRTAAQLLEEKKISADIIHIDAAHEYDSVVEDINIWFPILAEGGVLLGDDFSDSWPGVVQAACEFADKLSVDLHNHGKKWWIYKTASDNQRRSPSRARIKNCTSRVL